MQATIESVYISVSNTAEWMHQFANQKCCDIEVSVGAHAWLSLGYQWTIFNCLITYLEKWLLSLLVLTVLLLLLVVLLINWNFHLSGRSMMFSM